MSRPDTQRAAMNALFAVLWRGAQEGFWHAGQGYGGVPRWVVIAYVEARADRRLDLVGACAAAHLGAAIVAEHGSDPGWAGWTIARAWSARLGGLAAGAAGASGIDVAALVGGAPAGGLSEVAA